MIKALGLLLAAGMLAAISACDDGIKFTTKFASDVVPAQRTVSVLGVYKDGRMSVDGWAILGPRVAAALGSGECPVGYNILASTDGALAQAIDDVAQADGPTEELLAQLAPAARGDSILVLTFAGTLPRRTMADAGAAARPPPAPAMASPRGGGRMGGMRGGGRTRAPSGAVPEDTNSLDISAYLYSVRDARSIALLALQYTGTSIDEAVTKFAAKLAETFPHTGCSGWNWDAKIDPERVRHSAEE